MAAKSFTYRTRNGYTYHITYDKSKSASNNVEYIYEVSRDSRNWISYYGISQASLSTRSGAALLATLGDRGLRFLCDALDKGEEVPFRAIEQQDGSKYFKRLN